jgi:hypothetical protein
MKMSDSNLLFAQHTMAGVGTPIVVNNACLSWHRLAGNMTFGGARAYVCRVSQLAHTLRAREGRGSAGGAS